MVRGPLVEPLQPIAQEIAARDGITLLEEYVGYRMGRHCVGGSHLQRFLGQAIGFLQPAGLVVGEGVAPKEGPVVAAMFL